MQKNQNSFDRLYALRNWGCYFRFDEEAILLIYKDGAFTRKAVVDIIEEYVSEIKTADNDPIGQSPMKQLDVASAIMQDCIMI